MKRQKGKKTVYSFLFLLVGTIIATLCMHACKMQDNHAYRILIIQSYRDDCAWGKELNQGITDCFDKHRIPAEFTTFYLDCGYLLANEEIDTLKNLLDQCQPNPPDLIFLCDDQATYSFFATKHPLTYQLPIVFSGVDYPDLPSMQKYPNVTGFTTEPDFLKCYNLILHFYPDVKFVRFAINSSRLSALALDLYNRQIKEVKDSVIKRTVNMDKEKGLSLMWQLSVGNQMRPQIVPVWDVFYSNMTKTAIHPTFAVNSEGFGHGYLGGYITPVYDQTYTAAERGIEILRGNAPDKFPIEPSKKVLIFDWKEMQKFHIRPEQLPPGSTIAYMPFFTKYRTEIISALSLISILITGGAFLLIYLYREERELKIKVQERLQEHRDKLKVIMKSIREGVISIDKEMNIIAINTPALRWLKLDENDRLYIGRNLLSLIDVTVPGRGHYLKEMISFVVTKKRNTQFEYATQLTSLDKQWTFPVVGELVGMYENDMLYGMAITFHDITEEFTRKEFLALTLGTGNVTSWHLDVLHQRIIFDKAFFHIFNVEDDGTHSITLTELTHLIHPEDLHLWTQTYEKINNNRITQHTLQLRVDFNGMGYKWWEVRLSYSPGTKLNPTPTIFGLCLNIHKFKQTQDDLKKARLKAQQSDKLKSAFLANMSHEIRTPLNAIVGFSNLLTDNEEYEPEEKQLFISTIQNNCNLLLALLSDILDLARIESESMLFKEEICDVNELINHIFNTQQVIIPANLQLIKETPEETVYLKTDKLRIIQVLTNLINNAVKFTERGYVKIGYSKEADGYLHFFVEDTGKGIPEKDISNVFQRFFKKDDMAQGAGLGLSICKMIVDHFNGFIDVTSQPGQGSRFIVKIPYTKEVAQTPAFIKTTNNSIITNKKMDTKMNELQSSRINILIAEDEESNYLLLKTILQKKCNLFRARTGVEAIKIFGEQPVDLILMDIKMPEMNGIDTVKEIRKVSTEVPIVMQSAYVFDSDMEKAEQAGASGFLTKPINVKLLKETISKYFPLIEW